MELEEEFVATTPSFPFVIPPDDKLAGVWSLPPAMFLLSFGVRHVCYQACRKLALADLVHPEVQMLTAQSDSAEEVTIFCAVAKEAKARILVGDVVSVAAPSRWSNGVFQSLPPVLLG